MTFQPKTTYRGAIARIWHGNAVDLLKKLPKESVALVVSSPPYFMGKEYDRSNSASDFVDQHREMFPKLLRVLKPGGSLCWQVGHHVRNGAVIPLDALVYSVATDFPELVLRNRIVWTFNHGVHCTHRFSGRHESILWFTKGDHYAFDLDAVRVAQRYPGKRHYKGPHKGDWSGNPLGKNPGDVWDIPSVKAKHPEKTRHPCQFPGALVQRLIRALSTQGDTVLDPFLGSGTTAVVSLQERRNFFGSEIKKKYIKIAEKRIAELIDGRAKLRPDVPVLNPRESQAVAVRPPHFVSHGD